MERLRTVAGFLPAEQLPMLVQCLVDYAVACDGGRKSMRDVIHSFASASALPTVHPTVVLRAVSTDEDDVVVNAPPSLDADKDVPVGLVAFAASAAQHNSVGRAVSNDEDDEDADENEIVDSDCTPSVETDDASIALVFRRVTNDQEEDEDGDDYDDRVNAANTNAAAPEDSIEFNEDAEMPPLIAHANSDVKSAASLPTRT